MFKYFLCNKKFNFGNLIIKASYLYGYVEFNK